MKKILFAGHDLKFAKFIIEYFESKEEYSIKIDNWLGHNIHDESKSIELLEWADIIFCEWGLGNAVWYSNNKKENQKLIVRMHLQERETAYPQKFNDDNIDIYIAISPYIYEEFSRICKIPRNKMKMIYNIVDCEILELDKLADINFNLGIIGIIPMRKRLDRAINILSKLYEIDNRYKLFIKGKMPHEVDWISKNEEESDYYKKLMDRISKSPFKDNVIFEQYGDNIGIWLQKIGYVLSTSDFESFHLAPMEGAASGACPMVLNWEGSDTIYKNEWIFNNEDEIVDKIIEINKNGIDREKIKDYVKNNFDKKVILKEYEKLIQEL